MAILSKIRERSVFLIIVVGLALVAFVVDPSTISDFLNSTKVNEVGEVNGETISRQEFATALENYRAQAGNRVSEMQAAKTVWNNLVSQKIYEKQLAEAGITVGEEDILNSLYENPQIQNDPQFQTEGIFDKAKLKEFLATARAEGGERWASLRQNFAAIKTNLQRTIYNNLVGSGLGASLKEGENEYIIDNTSLTGEVVYVPYTNVVDSLVTIKKPEVEAYVKNHASEFEVEASRDINFVKFAIEATPEDENDIKKAVEGLINDKTENGISIGGFKSATDYALFFSETKSDLPYNDAVQYKSQVPQVIAEKLFEGKEGDVFGPYKDAGYYKLSKITEVLELPDSVQARHILIPFQGSRSATAETTQTEEDAKKTADSLATVVKANKSKFADLAKEFSVDKSNSEKGGELDWFNYSRMVPEFRDFTFTGKKGDVGVVKTAFGFHVIDIQDQKNFQNAIKLATFGRKIEASEATENAVYQKAETFAQELSNGSKIDELAEKDNLKVSPAVGLKVLDENVPSLGNEREIVTWSFEKDLEIGDYKRFDVDGGYVVAVLTGKTEEGLMSGDKAITKVRPILLKEKKAAILEDKFSASSLEEIATANKQSKRNVSNVSLKSPTLTGIGFEPKVVGAMLNAKENQLYKVAGDKGYFAFVVTKKELPTALPNYETYRTRIANQRKNKSYQMLEAIKKASDIENEVGSTYYGVGM